MSRYRAALYHLVISVVVIAGTAWPIVTRWYPGFLFRIEGGLEGLQLLAGVTLATGPLLTLLVYKAGKRGMGFDLVIIGGLQILAVAASLWVIYSERPIFFVYYDGHFYSASRDTYTDYGLQPPDPGRFASETPATVYVSLPNAIEEADVRRILYQDGVPLWTFSPWYRPLAEHLGAVIDEGETGQRLRDRDTEHRLGGWLAAHGGTFQDYAFIPIHSRYRNAYLGIRTSNRQIVGILEVAQPVGRAPTLEVPTVDLPVKPE